MNFTKIAGLLASISLLASCSNEAPARSALIKVTSAAQAACPQGGSLLQAGTDANGNGVLDEGEVTSSQTICNGGPGATPSLTSEPAGANCATGGVKLQVGAGTPSYVCNGGEGTSVVVTAEAPGDNCPAGGVKVNAGSAPATFVCSGTAGATGATGDAGQSVVVTPEPPGANCTAGGVKFQVGTGTPSYVCNSGCGSGLGAVNQANLVSNGTVGNLAKNNVQQTFTVSASGTLSGIELSLVSCTQSGTFVVSVFEGTTRLGSATAPVAGLACGSPVVSLQAGSVTGTFFDFGSQCLPVVSGHQYSFAISTTGLATNTCNHSALSCSVSNQPCTSDADCIFDLFTQANGSNTYAGGVMIVDGVPQGNEDAVFKIFVR